MVESMAKHVRRKVEGSTSMACLSREMGRRVKFGKGSKMDSMVTTNSALVMGLVGTPSSLTERPVATQTSAVISVSLVQFVAVTCRAFEAAGDVSSVSGLKKRRQSSMTGCCCFGSQWMQASGAL